MKILTSPVYFSCPSQVLGNMRFIGELFKLRMLTENIMHDCIFKLLRAKDDESLECMSQLMNTVGKDLDHERAKVGQHQIIIVVSYTGAKKGSCFKFFRVPAYLMQYDLLSILTLFLLKSAKK